MAVDPDGIAYIYENVGLAVAVDPDGVAYIYENVGEAFVDTPIDEAWGGLPL